MRIPLCCALLAGGLAMAQDPTPSRAMNGSGPRRILQDRLADQLMDRSNFVFVGTIVERNASNLSNVAHGPHTSLVRVERVLQGNPFLESLVGQVVTVRTERPAEHRAHQRSTFFLDVDAFGEHVSGLEMGRFTLAAGEEETHVKMVADSRLIQEDRTLGRRMRQAEQVVRGRVISVEPAGLPERISEHMAMWHKATIEVQTVLKGRPGTKMVTLFFPTSPDRTWKDAPRFAAGQEGVWLLHGKPVDGSRKAEMIPGLTSLEPQDFQHHDQSPRLQRILSNR